jgi:hypothetical protein
MSLAQKHHSGHGLFRLDLSVLDDLAEARGFSFDEFRELIR